MDAYDPTFAPQAFGLQNTGTICYLNSFLQTLAGCTSFTRAVLTNPEYIAQTATGAAVLAYVRAYAGPNGALAKPEPDIGLMSARVLAALTGDLAARRPLVRFRFGAGQESASEAFVHLLDMMEPASKAETDAQRRTIAWAPESPISSLFYHRYECTVACKKCGQYVSRMTDYSVLFDLFHLDKCAKRPDSVANFSRAIQRVVSPVEDYACEECFRRKKAAAVARGETAEAVKALTPDKGAASRCYALKMAPEILTCLFNLYDGYGGSHAQRYFPDRLEFPSSETGKLLVYRLVGQVEHSGSLHGGHYWARALRAGGAVHLLNDTGVQPSGFAASAGTYIITYHYSHLEDANLAAAAPKSGAAPPA